MAFDNPALDETREVLTRTRTIAVVGLSPDPDRPSYGVALYLKERGYHIVPVRPGVDEVLGQKAYASLLQVPFAIDLVNVFRQSRWISQHAGEAVLVGARGLWLQEGVIDDESAQRARNAGLFVVQDRCLLKEHRRAGLNEPATRRQRL